MTDYRIWAAALAAIVSALLLAGTSAEHYYAEQCRITQEYAPCS